MPVPTHERNNCDLQILLLENCLSAILDRTYELTRIAEVFLELPEAYPLDQYQGLVYNTIRRITGLRVEIEELKTEISRLRRPPQLRRPIRPAPPVQPPPPSPST